MLAGEGPRPTPDDSAVGRARLALEWGFAEPWAAAVDVGFESQRTAAYVTKEQSAFLAPNAGDAVRPPLPVRRTGMDGLNVCVGVQLLWLDASADGF